MCLPDFERFETFLKKNAVTGYRNWKNPIKTLDLKSESRDYLWLPRGERHKITDKNSGIYSYNNNYYNNYYYNNYYNNNNNNNNNYNNYKYYNNYYISGIVLQYGKVAIHKTGYRSEYVKVSSLFTIRESDAKGDDKFINWIKEFNIHIGEVAKRYKVNTIHWQDFADSNKANSAS